MKYLNPFFTAAFFPPDPLVVLWSHNKKSFLQFHLTCFPEIPKTETSFEERLILKAFLLKFMNAYAPIFYVAFFKGR